MLFGQTPEVAKCDPHSTEKNYRSRGTVAASELACLDSLHFGGIYHGVNNRLTTSLAWHPKRSFSRVCTASWQRNQHPDPRAAMGYSNAGGLRYSPSQCSCKTVAAIGLCKLFI